MQPQFHVRVADETDIQLVQGMWPEAAQQRLLADLLDEPCTMVGQELTEMLQLALQDLDPVECGMRLLEELFGKEMTRGMRDDIARDMLEGEPWVHHSHIQWHRGIYEAGWMANASHRGGFTRPHGCRVTFAVTALDDAAKALMSEPLTAALALRLVAPCAPEGILCRLFEDELAGPTFESAPHVAWFASWTEEADGMCLTIEGSTHWWEAFRRGSEADSRAWHDVQPSDEDDD